jgi:HTH-type transcriptional regulator / antitoxin HigA
MDIRPIRNDDDHARALAEIERLWDAEPGTPEHDRLEVLATLVEAYEDKRWPIEAPEPVEFLKAHMQNTGRTQADFARVIGSRSRASEILNRKRHLTLDMIWSLSRDWGLPAEALIKPYDLAKPAKRDTGTGAIEPCKPA